MRMLNTSPGPSVVDSTGGGSFTCELSWLDPQPISHGNATSSASVTPMRIARRNAAELADAKRPRGRLGESRGGAAAPPHADLVPRCAAKPRVRSTHRFDGIAVLNIFRW